MVRCDQCGDWNYTDKVIIVTVRDDLPPKSQLAIAIHELIEAYLCRENRISDQSVCAFDQKYEAERKEGKHGENDEPGDDPRAPYREEHQIATFVERAVCHALGISWKEHEQCPPVTEVDHH